MKSHEPKNRQTKGEKEGGERSAIKNQTKKGERAIKH
jgi:hypothetical protein